MKKGVIVTKTETVTTLGIKYNVKSTKKVKQILIGVPNMQNNLMEFADALDKDIDIDDGKFMYVVLYSDTKEEFTPA